MARKCLCGKDWNMDCCNLGLQSINSFTVDTSKIPSNPLEARKYVRDPNNLKPIPVLHILLRVDNKQYNEIME